MKEEKKTLRVAQVIGKFVGGGVESVVLNYYTHIDKSKIQFDFIFDEDSIDIPYELIENMGGRVIIIPPYQKIFKYHKELKKIFRENNYKIVHSHINTLSIFPLFAAKCAGVPIRIAHSHSTTNRKEKKRNLLKQLLRPFSKIFATDYISCSELAGRWLFGKKTYDKGEVYIMNNAIDLEKFKYNEEIRKEKRKELRIKEDTIVIGHIGRFVEAKNHKFLIEVFNKVHKKEPNSILILVGKGPLADEIKEEINNLGLNNSVKVLGQRSDVNELYQVMDCLVFPSLYEGLGMVLIEAQCSGLYCIASNNVPEEAKLTSRVEFLDLDESQDKWSEQILKTNYKLRENCTTKIGDSGYDINNECKKLERKYIELKEKIKK